MYRHSIILLIAVGVFGGGDHRRLAAEEPFANPANVTNAALVYWQAFALLPELNEEDIKLLSQLEQSATPLDEAKPLLARSSVALSFTRHVKRDTPCG